MPGQLRESLRGFPVWQMSVVCLLRFSEPIAFTSLFPYVYFMIRDFGIVKDPTKISAYTGYLLALFALFQFLMCVQWSRISDRVGRKPILLCGITGTAISMIIFGFAPNFYVALFARSLLGALNGNIAVLRTVIGEVATERRHQAVAFSTLPLLWNLGSVVGPLIGGSKYLTRPRIPKDHEDFAQYMQLESSLFSKTLHSVIQTTTGSSEAHSQSALYRFYDNFMNTYPYALSNVVVALFLLFSFIVGVLFLEETHPAFKRRRDWGLDLGDSIRKRLGFDVPARRWKSSRLHHHRKPRNEVETPLLDDVLVEELPSGIETAPLLDTLTPASQVVPYDSILEETLESPVLSSSSSLEAEAEQPQVFDAEAQLDLDKDITPLEFPGTGKVLRRLSLAFARRFSSTPSVRPTISRSTTGSYSFLTDTEIDLSKSKSGFNFDTFTPPVINTMTANFALSFHLLVFSEFLPVLLAGDLRTDKLKFPITITGGFGYGSDTIGRLLSSTGFLGVLVITILFPWIDQNFRTIQGYRLSASIFPFVYFTLPFIIFTLHEYNLAIPEWVSTALLYLLAAVATLASATAFPQIVILIHRATLPQHRALINGSTLSLNALARFIAPLTWGWMISLFDSLSLGGLSWWLLSGWAVMALFQAIGMQEYNEDLKTGEVEEREV